MFTTSLPEIKRQNNSAEYKNRDINIAEAMTGSVIYRYQDNLETGIIIVNINHVEEGGK